MMVVTEVAIRRQTICRGCHQWAGGCRLGHAINSAAACPLGRFPGYLPLGDAVEALAKPLVTVSDLLLGTKLRSCASCPVRKTRLNHAVRLGR